MIDAILPFVVLLVFAFLTSALLEIMVIPRVVFIAKKRKLFDIPDGRKTHKNLVPRLAGISFSPILLFVFSICALIYASYVPDGELLNSKPTIVELLGVMSGNLVLLAIGIKDDLVGSRYLHKMIAQIAAAILLVSSGLYINDFNGLFGLHAIPTYVAIPFTVLLIVFITNAINLMDGVDGLASGITSVALIAFGVFFYIRGMELYTLIAVILLGILTPFFCYNVFGTNCKIFMGDTGSLTLGFLLAFLGIRFAMNSNTHYNEFPAPAMLAISALFIPIFDALRVMVERALSGESMFMPDRRHIHHKLLDLGLSHKRVMLGLLMGVLFLIIVNFLMLYVINVNIVFAIDILMWLSFIKTLNILKRKRDTMGNV